MAQYIQVTEQFTADNNNYYDDDIENDDDDDYN